MRPDRRGVASLYEPGSRGTHRRSRSLQGSRLHPCSHWLIWIGWGKCREPGFQGGGFCEGSHVFPVVQHRRGCAPFGPRRVQFEAHFNQTELNDLSRQYLALTVVQKLPVDDRAVRRAKITHNDLRTVDEKFTVSPRNGRVGEEDPVALVAPDREFPVLQLADAAGVVSVDEHQFWHTIHT